MESVESSNKRKRLDECEYDPGEAYTPLIEYPGYNLIFYLSQYALDEFNIKQLSLCGFKYKKAELYENVDVVDAFKSLSSLHDTQTYLITFKAYMISNNTPRTFETKIIFRSRQTTKIVIWFVRIKGAPFKNLSSNPLLDYFSEEKEEESEEEEEEEEPPTYRPRRQPPSRGIEKDSPLGKELECFERDWRKSGGFEVGHYPLMDKAKIYGTWMTKYYDIENKSIPAVHLSALLHFSQLAVCVYNMKHDTHFDNVKVLKTMTYLLRGSSYNISFEASLSDKNAVIFQTTLSTSIALPVAKVDIEFVRIKSG